MSWQILEDDCKLTFSRYFPELKIYLRIDLDHLDPSCAFYGEAYDSNNDDFASCTGPTFYSVMDKLINEAYNRKK